MDSINRNQEEDNKEDLFGKDAQEKIKELVKEAKTCLFCTRFRNGLPFATRPMSVQDVDENGHLWFLSADDSHKNAELEVDNHVQLLFQGSSYTGFLSLYGTSNISRNKSKIHELWNPIYKTWFTEGKDDPRITVIEVSPEEGYYWDTKNNLVIGMIKRVAGAVSGKTIDDSIEGKIRV